MAERISIAELADWIRQHDDYVLIGHILPDGDAVGSCMAMQLALQSMGKRAFVCLPGGMPALYACFPGAENALKPESEFPFEPRTAFALDVSELPRLRGAEHIFNGCQARALLDHHKSNKGFGDVWHMDGGRIANGELVMELIRELGVEISADMATWLYVAISMDSGHFRYEDTCADTLRKGAELMETGMDAVYVTRQLYQNRSLSATRLLGCILDDMHLSPDGRIAWARMTDAMLDRCGAMREEKEGLVNYLLEVRGVELAVLAEERGCNTKFSLRSKEWLDVAALAGRFGGGGHIRAAGCTIDNTPIDAALEILLKEARAAMNNEE